MVEVRIIALIRRNFEWDKSVFAVIGFSTPLDNSELRFSNLATLGLTKVF